MFSNARNTVKAAVPTTELAKTIAVPHEMAAQRLPSYPNLERTATVRTASMVQYSIPPGVSRSFLLCRSPVYPFWAEESATLVNASVYFNATYTYPSPRGLRLSPTGSSLDPNEIWQEVCFNGVQDLVAPTRWPFGQLDNGNTFLYIPGGDGKLVVEIETQFSDTSLYSNFTFEVFDGENTRTVSYVLDDAAAAKVHLADVPITGPAWVRLVTVTHNASQLDWVLRYGFGWSVGTHLAEPVGTANVTGFWPVTAIPEFSNSMIPYESSRQNASAVLLSNVSSYLNKEGTVSATRLPRCSSGYGGGWIWNPSIIPMLPQFTSANPTERYYGKLEKGIYSYTLPDASSEKFRDFTLSLPIVFNGGSQAMRVPAFFLDGFDYVNVIVLSDLDTSGSTALAITVDSHLEFRTSSALFNLGYCSVPLEDYHRAQMALAQCGVFFENPTHLGAIAGMVGRAAMSLGRLAAPYVKAAAVRYGPPLLQYAAGRIARTVSTRIQPQPQMPPTPRVEVRKPKPKPRPKQQTRVSRKTQKKRTA